MTCTYCVRNLIMSVYSSMQQCPLQILSLRPLTMFGVFITCFSSTVTFEKLPHGSNGKQQI